MALKAGVARVNITPPVGVDMTGFGNRPGPSVGVHDELYATVLVLENGSESLVLITTDLLGFDPDLIDVIRQGIEQRWGIDFSAVMLSASHTHSGPATITLRGLGERDEPYLQLLVRKILGAVQMALARCQPARLERGRAPVQVGINRRHRREDGRMQIGFNSEGPVAPYVDVLKVVSEAGQGLGCLFSHAAHPVVLGGENRQISADFPGQAREFIERVEPGLVMFAQGCCGNINAHPRESKFEGARQLGWTLGAAVVGCMQWTEPLQDQTLASASEVAPLPLMPPPSIEDALALVERHQAHWQQVQSAGKGRSDRYLAKGMLEWAEDLLRASKGEIEHASQSFEVQVFRLGEVALVALAGEAFVEYALTVDANSPYAQTFVFGYTNGCIGYVPTAAAYPKGGYEVDQAYRYYGTLMIAPESETLIHAAAQRLLASTLQTSDSSAAS